MKNLAIAILLTLSLTAPVKATTYVSVDGGQAACPAPTAAAPIWAKLVIESNVVTCFYAKGTAAPTTWTQLGKAQTINFVNNPILIGLYITSHDTTKLSTGTIDNLTITPAPSYRLADCDIGGQSLMGSANLINGVWTLTGSGADIYGGSDQFNFQPWLVWGDCTVVCRITGLSTGDDWQKIGIMARDGYNTGSDYAMFTASQGNGVSFQYRAGFNKNNDVTQLVAPPSPNTVSSVTIGYSLTGSMSYVLRP